jgi:hypothetical protein
VKGIQVCSNKGDKPSLRGNNSERVKFKFSSPKPAGGIQSYLIQIFKVEIITKM